MWESGDILFDSRTKSVMSQSSQDGIVKEKVLAVREVVPGRSNEQIILVLTYYEYSVNDAIQAFLEDGAKAALEEWHYPGNKPNNKKKKKKQAQKKAEQAAKESKQAEAAADNKNTPSTKKEEVVEAESVTKEVETPKNGTLQEASNKPTEAEAPKEVALVNGEPEAPPKSAPSVTTTTKQPSVAPTTKQPSNAPTTKQPSNAPKKSSEAFMARTTEATASSAPNSAAAYQRRPTKLETGSSKSARERTFSEMSASSVASSTGGDRTAKAGKPHAGLEKSMKDLQRQTLSLQRLRLVLGEEVEKSFKTMSVVFDDLRLALNEREAELMFAMDKAKAQANETLQRRQSRAKELKVRTDRAQVMSDSELSELRADIKHFVSERKLDEDMTKSARFVCEAEQLLQQIKSFGEVSPVKHAYSVRRPSVSSVCSSVVSHDEPLTPLTPTTPIFAVPSMPVSSVNHSNTPSEPTLSASPKSREVATLTEKFMSAVSLQETPPPTPSHKSASTSPQRPLQSAPPSTSTLQLDDGECEIVRRPRNARRRQKQKLRERGQDGTASEDGSERREDGLIFPPPSNDLEKKERPASHQPKQVANRGTSPMKHPSTQSQGKPGQGQNQENQRSSYRRGGGGQGQRSHPEGHTNQQGGNREHFRGSNQQTYDKQRHDYNGQGQMQGPRPQRDRRPRGPYNKPGVENNGPRNGPLQPTVNGPTVNGAVNGEVKAPHRETNNNRKTPDVNGDGERKPSVEPLKETDLKLNKQDSHVAPAGKRDAANNNHKLIEVGGGDHPKVGLPQRGPRQRGSRHAQENHKSQLTVNGDQAPSANGHS